MSKVVYYTGPRRIDLGLRTNQYFVSRDQIPEIVKKAMEANSAFANFFEDEQRFRRRPPPGSHLFEGAKIARQPPQGRTSFGLRAQPQFYRPRATKS